jgi:hypothetical protein
VADGSSFTFKSDYVDPLKEQLELNIRTIGENTTSPVSLIINKSDILAQNYGHLYLQESNMISSNEDISIPLIQSSHNPVSEVPNVLSPPDSK